MFAELTTADVPYVGDATRRDTGRASNAAGAAEIAASDGALRVAYGENDLGLRNIPLASGSVTVRGSAIPAGHSVYVAGRAVPVDENGSFVAQEILPSGVHTVEVAVLDPQGNGELYLRDIELERNDWFYVGMADLTLTSNDTNGPIELLQGENATYDFDSSADARLAFYVNGKFNERWHLTASADTRDEPLYDLFSNFLNKSPDALFRRIDPDYHFPTFGDDGIVEEMAPTLGKLYVKAGRGETYGEWGNFQIGYMNNELAQVDRGLYGANMHYESQACDELRRTALRDRRLHGRARHDREPRGVSRHRRLAVLPARQDILTGSERVRIEFRDRASGLVTGVVNLTPAIDYEIDYSAGPPVADRAAGLDARRRAARARRRAARRRGAPRRALRVHAGLRGARRSVDRRARSLLVRRARQARPHGELERRGRRRQRPRSGRRHGADQLRFVVQAARRADRRLPRRTSCAPTTAASASPATTMRRSPDADAGGYRADVALGLGDFLDGKRGRLTMYTQSLDGGYAAPGLQTLTDTENYGGMFQMPVTERISLRAKSDHRSAELGLTASAHEINVAYG